MVLDEKWPIARLIPTTNASGVEAQERNAASALLAVMASVKEFGRAVLKPLGAPAGTIQTFVEVPFTLDGKKVRPDGLIAVTRGPKTWVALVETKIGSSSLEVEQIQSYLDIAKEHGYDTVLSISNHYVTASREYPIEVDKRRTRRVRLAHLSWTNVLADAVVQKEHRGVSDPDQAYILGELIRYLSDPRSGVVAFGTMGPGWTKVKDGARDQTLRKTDEAVAEVAARWDDLIRYLCLSLTMDLGRDVSSVTRSKETSSSRFAALKDALATNGVLEGAIAIPDVAGNIKLKADLRARQLSISTTVDAPREGGSRGRIGWLLRQLRQAPGETRVEAKVARSQTTLADILNDVREHPESLLPPKDKEIRGFELSLTRPIGLKRDRGTGSFIDGVLSTSEDFYRLVLQDLRPWKPSPPKLKPKAVEEEDETEEVPAPIASEVEAAREEMEREAATD